MTRDEFEHIAPRLRTAMMRVGQEFFGDRDEAEDVAQDGLVRLWHYCERLDSRRNMENLAVMVAKNLCVERHKRRREMMGISSDPPAQQSYDADAPIRAVETERQIDMAIGHLAPREQQLVRKRHLEDKTTDEIAEETGIPKASVKTMLSMAMAKLKKRLKQ